MKSINRPLTLRRDTRALDPDAIAAQALGFIAADGERLQRFLAITGFDPTGLRAAAAGSQFTRALLSYLGSDEALLVEFAASEGLDPDAVGRLVQRVVEDPGREDM